MHFLKKRTHKIVITRCNKTDYPRVRLGKNFCQETHATFLLLLTNSYQNFIKLVPYTPHPNNIVQLRISYTQVSGQNILPLANDVWALRWWLSGKVTYTMGYVPLIKFCYYLTKWMGKLKSPPTREIISGYFLLTNGHLLIYAGR